MKLNAAKLEPNMADFTIKDYEQSLHSFKYGASELTAGKLLRNSVKAHDAGLIDVLTVKDDAELVSSWLLRARAHKPI